MELISDFENLRREMLENSREIIRLLKQRIKLAQKIGEIKKMNGGEIHDYNREREIIKLISGDRFTQSVLNILFEFSIHYESYSQLNLPGYVYKNINGNNYMEFNGETKNLLGMLKFILNPGSVVFSENKEYKNLISGPGIHIINHKIEDPDVYVDVNGNYGGDIIINGRQMLISKNFLENRENIYRVIIR